MSPNRLAAGGLPDARVLPSAALASQPHRTETPFAVYLHVPYCRVRCGYCDFNTYTNLDMGGGASASDYVATLADELAVAARAMQDTGLPDRPASTVFLGGGTPTMLPAADLAHMLELVRTTWGLAQDAEITTEANPETVDEGDLASLAQAGFTRVSFGMQSAVPDVLATLDRIHRPERVAQVVAWARNVGLNVSVDLIYGTPGESLNDWRRSVEAAIAVQVDHISAYALVIEKGTRMWTKVRRGELPMPSDDDEAVKYEVADQLLGEAGYQWYEISNWARPGYECRHNLAYWRDWDWYGAGPGAHSHFGDLRMWNTKAPVAWAAQVRAGRLPVSGHEVLGPLDRELERAMLGVRMREGLVLADLVRSGEATTQHGTPVRLVSVVGDLVSRGLVDPAAALEGRIILTLKGRLFADAVTTALTGGNS